VQRERPTMQESTTSLAWISMEVLKVHSTKRLEPASLIALRMRLPGCPPLLPIQPEPLHPRFQVRPAAPQPNLAAFLLSSVPGRRTHTTEARPASIKIIQFPNTRSGIHPTDLPLFLLLKLWPICLACILSLFSTRRRGLLVGPSTCGAKPLQTFMTPPLLQLSLSRSRPLSSDCASIREQNSAWCSLPGDHDGPDGMQTMRCRLSQESQGARRDTRQTKEEAGAQPESVKSYLLTTMCSLQWHLRLCQLPGGKGPKVHR